MPKISVMMPAYNAEDFIAQAIDSILIQDFQDFQIVVSDDASTDGTAAIIRRYQEKYPDKIIAIYNSSNVGVTKNCNMALKQCTGDYVSLFAGDDVMLPGKFSKQIALMEDNPECVLCYHPVEIFDSGSGKTFFVTNQQKREDVHSTQDLLLKGGIPGGCSIMVRRDAIPVGGYDNRLKTVSDWLFFLEISTKGRICKLDDVLARYRKHQGGASRLTYSLLSESLYALDLFAEKHPNCDQIASWIRHAKARYIAGEAFRQLKNDPAIALSLASSAFSYQKNAKYFFVYMGAFFNRYMPGFGMALKIGSTRIKYILKRFLG